MKKNLIIVMAVVMCSALGCKQLSSGSNSSTGSKNSIFANLKELSLVKGTGTPKTGDGKIKGKIAIVQTYRGGGGLFEQSLDRFSDKGVFNSGQAEKTKNFFPPEIYAQNLDELDTLILIDRTAESFDVSVIDYKTKAALDKFEYEIREDKSVDYYNIKEDDRKNVLLARTGDYLTSLENELSPAYFQKPLGEPILIKDLHTAILKSADAFDQYKDKDVVITGYTYGSSKSSDTFTILYRAANQDGTTIPCWFGSVERLRFQKLPGSKFNQITVIGTIEVDKGDWKTKKVEAVQIKNCRLIKSQEAVQEESK